MAKNKKNDYFNLIEQQVECCVEAAGVLEDIICNYEKYDLSEQRERIHKIEHKADEIHHDILMRLSAEFITPIDQEDILRLVQIIDDITDALDEVVLECYMFHIKKLPEDASVLAKTVERCVNGMYKAAKELKNFKKPETLRSYLVEVNTVESEADEIYVEAIHKLFAKDIDSRELFGSKAIYDCLEDCCDLCEHVTDAIEQIVIKNT